MANVSRAAMRRFKVTETIGEKVLHMYTFSRPAVTARNSLRADAGGAPGGSFSSSEVI
jgi:hypothetical protein